jgi:hypothetical protein
MSKGHLLRILHHTEPGRDFTDVQLSKIQKYEDRMIERNEKRIKTILDQIERSKPGSRKKHMICNSIQEKRICHYLDANGIAYQILNDLGDNHEPQFRRKVIEIYPGYDSRCCRECDYPPDFITKKVPVKYIFILK